jgi:phosphatidylinositol 4-kinase
MKPILDRVVDMIVDSLSGEAQDFYNREFSFFDEVTSISAKLKPFIKSSKAEKKVSLCVCEESEEDRADMHNCTLERTEKN